MSTPFQQFVNRELPKRIFIDQIPVTGNLPKGKILKTSGVGLGVEITDDDPLKPDTMVIINQPGGAPIYLNKIVEIIGEEDLTDLPPIPSVKLFSQDSTNIPLGLLINALDADGTDIESGATYVVGGQLALILQKGRCELPDGVLDLTGANPGQYVYCDGDGNLTLLKTDFVVGQVLSASANSIFVNIGGGSSAEDKVMNGGVWINGITAVGGSIGGISYLNNDSEYGIISGFKTDALVVRLGILANSGHSYYKPRILVKTTVNTSGVLADVDRSSSNNFEWTGTVEINIDGATEIIVEHNDGPKYVCSIERLTKPQIDSFTVHTMPRYINIHSGSLESQTSVKAADSIALKFRLLSTHTITKVKFGVGTDGLGNNDILVSNEVDVNYTGPQSEIVIENQTIKNFGAVTGLYRSYIKVMDNNGIWSEPAELSVQLAYNNSGVNISSAISYTKSGNGAIGSYSASLNIDLARVDTSISDLPNGVEFAYKFDLLTGSINNYKNLMQYYNVNTPIANPSGQITPEAGTSHNALDYNIGFKGNYQILNFTETVGRLSIQRRDTGKVTNHDFIIKLASVVPSISSITKPSRFRVPDPNALTRSVNEYGNPIPVYGGPQAAIQYQIIVIANQPLKSAPSLLFDTDNDLGMSWVTAWATTDNVQWSRTLAVAYDAEVGNYDFALGSNLENLGSLTGNSIVGGSYKIGGFAERDLYVPPWNGEIPIISTRSKIGDVTKLRVVNESSTDDANANVFHAASEGQNVEAYRSANLPWEDGDYTLCNALKIFDTSDLSHWYNLRIGNASSNTTGFFVRIEEVI